ncbi:MAG: hypothetical protein IPJ01_10770 [Micavibrio sp.]|nr:hypothetical protein [Micavibrio sp.]
MENNKVIDFTKKERYIIAEYVYSYRQDILIVSDAKKLLEVLKSHNLMSDDEHETLKYRIDNKSDGITDDLIKLLESKVSKEQGISIIDEYLKGDNW